MAIQKFILSSHPEVPPDKLKQRLLLTLRQGVTNKRLVKVKASYKIHPDAKKKKKSHKKKPEKKKLTKEQLAAQREKERQEAKEKERLERIRKRKFPMEDLALIAEDKELKVHKSLPARPSLPLLIPSLPSACKSDTMGSGILDDAFHVYHFFRGDVGWGRYPKNKDIVAPFTLQQWLACVEYVMRGGARKARMLPPLMTHLFVVALQRLVPTELEGALTPATWSEILMLYMDAMERYYTSEASQDLTALPGLGIDPEYLFGVTNIHKDESLLKPPTKRESNFYLQGNLEKIQSKLYQTDPWLLSAEELLALLRVLVDDLLATEEDCSHVMEDRLQETYELLRTKREADVYLRKIQSLWRKEQNEQKEQQDNAVKVTRSNTKLPTISEAQLESARRAQVRATDAYEKACREKRIRTEPIGQDRNFNSFYYFSNDAEKVYVAQRGKALPSSSSFSFRDITNYRTTWHTIDQRSKVEKYTESLDVRGRRENALKNSLQPTAKTVEDDIKAMNDKKALLKDKKDLQRRLENAKLKCEVGRKSGRLAAQSEQEFFALQAEIDNLTKVIAGDVEPPKPSMEVVTGLEMLREFDSREDQAGRRRTTRREAQKQEEGEEAETATKFPCSKLWSTGNVDGTGLVGSIVGQLLELEERVDDLADWEKGDRKSWIANLETSVHSWHMACPQAVVEDKLASQDSPLTPSESKKQRRSSDGTSSLSVAQVLNMLKVSSWRKNDSNEGSSQTTHHGS